ncbi:MAG: HEAT repeat domain-containing protein, partial [Myxococcales bacterium]|nr:HEAT repeat domain-containing protein [Myxococcales bacterium]
MTVDAHLSKFPRRTRIERGCGDPWIDVLAEDPLLRRAAVDSLRAAFEAEDGEGRGLAWVLREALSDSHAPVRSAAVLGLGRLPSTHEGAIWLIEALDDPMPSVREAACHALARSCHEHAVAGAGSRLAGTLREDPVWWVRRAAARALAAVAGVEAIDALLVGLEDPFWRVRHAVVQALGLIVEHGTSPDEREALRLRVLAAGEALDEAARAALAYLAGGWPEGEDEVPAVLGIIRDPGAGLELSDPDPAVVTARLLASDADAVSPEELLPLLAESHVALRDEALRRLARLEPGDASGEGELASILGPALAWIEDPRTPNAAAAVAALLDRLGPRAQSLAARALDVGRPGALAWAARFVGIHPAEVLHDRVVALHDHPEPRVREAVMDGLGGILVRERGRAPEIEAVLVAGLGDEDRAVLGAAARALAAARCSGRHLQIDGWSRLRARDRLVLLGDPSVRTEILEQAVSDGDGRVRAAAIVGLDGRGLLTAERRRRFADDPDPLVREAALDLEEALRLATSDLEELPAALRRAAARLLLRGAALLEQDTRERVGAGLFAALDPVLRMRAVELIDPSAPSASELERLLAASRDTVPMVRSAAADQLRRVPGLADRLEPVTRRVAADDPDDLRLAAWSTLICACGLEAQEALARLEAGLRRGQQTIPMVGETVTPREVAAQLGHVTFDHVLGYFETTYSRAAKHRARTYNLRLAASRLDGTVLMPGEEFDFNGVVGPRDEANGYRVAPVIAQGEL